VNILIVKLSAIGDVIHTLPSLSALRRLYPEAHITWVVEEAAADLLVGHPALDRLLVSRRKSWLKEIRRGRWAATLAEGRAFLKALRGRPYDLVIDFHGLFKSALVVLVSGGRRRLGYASLQEASGLFYNERIPEAKDKHAVDRYLDFVRHLAREAGNKEGEPAAPEFALAIGAEEQARVATLLAWPGDGRGESEPGPTRERLRFVAVNPVAFWETKLWEEEKFAALCDRIRRELGASVVLTGGEKGPLERIRSRMHTEARNLGGETTLRELACLYREAALVISTDSGPMHLAAAVGTPVVALFGPTDPRRTGPYGPGHRIIRSGLSCAPCLKRRCDSRCCMQGIGVDEVFAAVREILDQQGVAGPPPHGEE
jgi:3-deoxy-D-manno-octulosonic-acid transferase/heptosyltransferase-1